jgi:hypothetical protein
MVRRLIAVAFITALTWPGLAAAQGALPPDDSGVDQYVEGLPGPKGSVPSVGVGKGRDRGAKLPPGVTSQLESLGDDGRAVVEFAEATAPRSADRVPTRGSRRGDGGPSTASEAPSGVSAISRMIGEMVGGEGGMGLALPLILVLTALGAVAGLVMRNSRNAGQG